MQLTDHETHIISMFVFQIPKLRDCLRILRIRNVLFFLNSQPTKCLREHDIYQMRHVIDIEISISHLKIQNTPNVDVLINFFK